jgi:hypothetical protein
VRSVRAQRCAMPTPPPPPPAGRWLGKHANVIKLRDLMVNTEEDEVYLVMELMDSDLHR